MGMQFSISGARKADEALRAMPANARECVWDHALIPTGYNVFEAVQARTPVDTELLKSSERIEFSSLEDMRVSIVVPDVVRPNQPDHPYDLYVEFGTVKTPEFAMIRDSIQEYREVFDLRVMQCVNQAINEIEGLTRLTPQQAWPEVYGAEGAAEAVAIL